VAIRLMFTPHSEAEAIFGQVRSDLLVATPNIRAGFISFLERVVPAHVLPRLLVNVSSEAGSRWDRARAYSDYSELVAVIERRGWQVRVARFSLRVYCLDSKLAIVSTVNPAEDGRVLPGGVSWHDKAASPRIKWRRAV